MEMEGGAVWSATGSLSRKPSSFRLRSPSLNSVRLRRVFDLFDKNGDEILTADEIAKALIVLGLDADPSELALQSIISSYVKSGAQGLAFEGFALLHKSLDEALFNGHEDVEEEEDLSHCTAQQGGVGQEDTDLAEAFKVFDQDGDGYISARELQLVLHKLGLPQSREMEAVERMISSVDCNHDGVVDFSEFKYMMRDVSFQFSEFE